MAPSPNQSNRQELLTAESESPSIQVSVIVPVAEGHDDLVEIYRTHARVLREAGYIFEFIFVIDPRLGPVAEKLETLVTQEEPIRIVVLSREYGEATALTIGFQEARGEVLMTLPAYFQTVPDGLAKVLRRLENGEDLVIARRWPRTDGWINRVQNYVFHFITRLVTQMPFRDLNCGLKGMRRPVVREIHLYGELHRFLPLLACQRGFRVAEVLVPQHPKDVHMRIHPPWVYVMRLLDILTLVFLFKFIEKPLRFFGLLGGTLFGSGFLISLMLTIQKIAGSIALADRPLLILGVLLMVLGIQTGCIGLLGEIIIFTHARKMKRYTIERFLK